MKKYFLFAILLQFYFLKIAAQLTNVVYQDGMQKLNGIACVAKKTSKTKPGVLILPAWKGIDKHAKDSAEMLAKLGYTAFIADIYGEGNYPTNTQEAGKQAGFYKKKCSRLPKTNHFSFK